MAGIVESAPNGANHSTTTLTHNSCCSTFCFRNFSKALGEICSSKISPDGGLMPKGIVLFCLILGCCLFATLAADQLQQATPAQSQEASSAAKMPTPADGYNVHVLAPHLGDGMIYHFYFDGTLPNGKTSIAQAVGHKPLSEAEYKASMAAK